MNKLIGIALCSLILAACVHAQELNVVRTSGTIDAYALANIDSMTFAMNAAQTGATPNRALRVHVGANTTSFLLSTLSRARVADRKLTVVPTTGDSTVFELSGVDSLDFANLSAGTVGIAYNGSSVTVTNPLAAEGVAVAVSGADVVVISTTPLTGVEYVLSGTTTDGTFKVYSDQSLQLTLNGVQLTNADGPAINVQSHHAILVDLVTGTSSVLTDGATYATAPNSEDQKAAFFSEGQLIFTGGSGTVTINGHGTSQHGLCSDDYIAVESGTIVVASAVKDAIHTNDGYFQSGGAVQVTGSSDGVDAGDGAVTFTGGTLTSTIGVANRDALKGATTLTISGGIVNLNVNGNQSKGLRAARIVQSGGTVTVHTTGGMVLVASGSGYDPSYCTAVKADSLVEVSGGQMTITTTGVAGRGISCDGELRVTAGTVNINSSGGGGTYTNSTGVLDAYHGPCLNADRNMVLSGGSITLSHSGSAGKGLSGDANLAIGTASSSPTLQITTTGAKIAIGSTGEYAEAKAVSFDSTVTIRNGVVTITSADDGIKAKYRLDIYGGTITVNNAIECFEAPYLYVYGGTIHAIASDDCLNATWGTVSGGSEADDGSIMQIDGGYLYLVAQSGDGLDSNGRLTINGGTTIVDGPASQPNVGIDVNGTFAVNGGFLLCAQASGMMVETPASTSLQRCLLANRSSALTAGTLYHIENAAGQTLVTFAPPHNYSSVLLSTSGLASGTSYKIYTGGAVAGGSVLDGLYTGGTYSGGTLRTTFTSSGQVQTVTF